VTCLQLSLSTYYGKSWAASFKVIYTIIFISASSICTMLTWSEISSEKLHILTDQFQSHSEPGIALFQIGYLKLYVVCWKAEIPDSLSRLKAENHKNWIYVLSNVGKLMKSSWPWWLCWTTPSLSHTSPQHHTSTNLAYQCKTWLHQIWRSH